MSGTASLDTLVFDCGDTLLQLAPSRATIARDVLDGLGIKADEATVESAMRLAELIEPQRSSVLAGQKERRDAYYTQLNERIAMNLGIARHRRAFARDLQAAIAARGSWQPVAGARQALAALAARYTLHVLANWDARLERLLDDLSLREHFGAVLASESLGAEKPDRAAFMGLVERTGVDPRRTAYVGNDYEPDVFGSRRAGFTPILLDHYGRYSDAVDCRRVSDFSQLQALLLAPAGVEPESRHPADQGEEGTTDG